MPTPKTTPPPLKPADAPRAFPREHEPPVESGPLSPSAERYFKKHPPTIAPRIEVGYWKFDQGLGREIWHVLGCATTEAEAIKKAEKHPEFFIEEIRIRD